jgi:hypothetical protein
MRRLALFCGVLLAIAVVAVIAWRTEPSDSPSAALAAGQTVAVTSVTRSCPPAPPGARSARVAMIAMSSPASASATGVTAALTGSATLSPVPVATVTSAPTVKTVKTGKTANAANAANAGKSGQAKATGKDDASGKSATKASTPAEKNAPVARPVTVSAPGAITTVTVPGKVGAGGTGGATVAATGQMAEGFEAEQVDSSGVGLVSCTHPGSDMWFVGTGATDGAPDVWLYLMNTGTGAASADVTILSDTGQQNGLDNAITVAPDQVVAENVAPYVGGSQALALHVQTSSGQVAASVWEGDGAGNGAWLPQAAAPSTTLVIPGLTVASSAARLFVTVPGSTDARLKVTAYTPAGAVAQFSTTPVDASAAATTPVTLSSLGASAAGLELTSNVPIVAGVLVPGAGIGSFTTASAPVTEQAVAAGNPAARGLTVGLLLTAPAGTAHARITVVPEGSTGATGTASSTAGQAVTVQAGHTLAVAVPRPSGRHPFAIVLTPQAGSGPLYAVRVVTSGTGGLSAPVSSLLPMTSALTAVTLSPVKNSYTAVLP